MGAKKKIGKKNMSPSRDPTSSSLEGRLVSFLCGPISNTRSRLGDGGGAGGSSTLLDAVGGGSAEDGASASAKISGSWRSIGVVSGALTGCSEWEFIWVFTSIHLEDSYHVFNTGSGSGSDLMEFGRDDDNSIDTSNPTSLHCTQ